MWPRQLLRELPPLVFHGRVGSLQKYFTEFVMGPQRAKWASEVSALEGLIDIRDYFEDTWALLLGAYGIAADAPEALVSTDRLVRALKAVTNLAHRRELTVAFLVEHTLKLRPLIGPASLVADCVAYAIDREMESYFSTAGQLRKYMPLLTAPRETVETVVSSMESAEGAGLEQFQGWGRTLGEQSIWPVLAIWASVKNGTVDETFLHAPLPRIFGAPSCVRNAIERQGSPPKLVKISGRNGSLDANRAVLAGHGQLAYRAAAGPSDFVTVEAPRAHLVAGLPGVAGRCVWALRPESYEAAIYQLEPAFKTLAEFELPRDELEGPPNWIDCQRDSEGSLVLLWGRINSLTGALYTQHIAAFDEDQLLADSFEFLETTSGSVPNRRKPGARIDFRDHGNLLSVHHTVEDDNSGTVRRWTHHFDVVFGNHLLMTLETDSRPVEAIYGSPLQMLLLSPLSSKALQTWTYVTGVDGADGAYKMTAAVPAPRRTDEHSWASCTVI